jgi:hypothetical protein
MLVGTIGGFGSDFMLIILDSEANRRLWAVLSAALYSDVVVGIISLGFTTAVKLTIATLIFSIASFLFAREIVRYVETEVFSSFWFDTALWKLKPNECFSKKKTSSYVA